MATGLGGFATHLEHIGESMGEFRAIPYYEPETDALIYYIRDESSYSKQVTKYFTVFLSNRDESLVGFEVKGLKTICKAIEDLGGVKLMDSVSVKDEDGDSFELDIIVRCALVPPPVAPVKPGEYAEYESLGRDINVNRREMCSA